VQRRAMEGKCRSGNVNLEPGLSIVALGQSSAA
jgi:hypothetical protein